MMRNSGASVTTSALVSLSLRAVRPVVGSTARRRRFQVT